MNLKLLMINICLAGLLVLAVALLHSMWRNGSSLIMPLEESAASGASGVEAGKKLIQKRSLVESSYRIIVNRNIFSPDRKPPVVEEASSTPETIKELRVSGRRVALHGVLLAGDSKRALISNPLYGAEDKALYKWVKEGEALGDFRVLDIQRDTILVSEGRNQYRILLYDRNKPATEAPSTVAAAPAASSPAGQRPAVTQVRTTTDDQPKPRPSTPFGIILPTPKDN